MIVYITKNLTNGKKYIGKDQSNDPNYLGSGIHLKRAIKKYGKDNFVKEVIEYCDTIDKLNEREIYWIEYFNASKSNEYYNIASGGDGGNTILGYDEEQLNEYKKKLSISLKGKKHTTETKKVISEKRMGIVYTEETKQKISESVKKLWQNEEYKNNFIQKMKLIKRKPCTDETKKKISIATKGKNNGKIPWNRGKKNIYSEKTLILMGKGKSKFKGEKNPSYGKKWMNKDGKNIYIQKELIDDYIKIGYKLGMIKKLKNGS